MDFLSRTQVVTLCGVVGGHRRQSLDGGLDGGRGVLVSANGLVDGGQQKAADAGFGVDDKDHHTRDLRFDLNRVHHPLLRVTGASRVNGKKQRRHEKREDRNANDGNPLGTQWKIIPPAAP